jgi:serine/threonine protein kinase
LIPAKQEIVRDNTEGEFGEESRRVRGLLESRLASLREQLTELTELRGKNAGVVEYMMGKVRAEKDEFEAGLQRCIARMRHADTSRTSTGMVLGTPRYMSPEQISGQPVDQRSDIFSLGTVLYEMLTQTTLFAGQDVNQIAHSVTSTEPAPPSRSHPGLPQMLDFVVARALKKDQTVRYQDA